MVPLCIFMYAGYSMKRRLQQRTFPVPIPLLKMIGPSIIFLGLGLGSGEVILWPYLTSRFGMGIIWGAVLGVTFQFFMNMEIERYALVRGESVFVGLKRMNKLIPVWFLFSTFIPWIWPGIIASSGAVFGSLLGFSDSRYLTIILLLLIGVILTLGPILYKTVESFQKILVSISIPFILLCTFLLLRSEHITALAEGLVGKGQGYMFLPAGISLASFLAAFAYSGAGGNLNLAQSYYIKEKGYGMGKYAGRITSIVLGKTEKLELEGSTFPETPAQLSRFRQWWRKVNLEHALVFWVTGVITILALALLAYITMYAKRGELGANIGFLIGESQALGSMLFPFVGILFLCIAGLTLFGTQLTVFDATSRILAENTVLLGLPGLSEGKRIRPLYYIVLWLQILASIAVFAFGFSEPLALLTFAAVLNACAMFVHLLLVSWMNMRSLSPVLRPAIWRRTILAVAAAFYGGFSLYSIIGMLS